MAVYGKHQPSTFFSALVVFFGQLLRCLPVLLLAAGCARLAPRPVPLAAGERAQVLSGYRAYLHHVPLCPGVEADVQLQYQSLFKDARIPGVLAAKAPASIKVMGLNPLGQPMLVFSVHGGRFTLIDVQGQKGYSGRITAGRVAKLLPLEDLAKAGLYDLLTGAPALPIESGLAVSRLRGVKRGFYLLTWPEAWPRKQIVFNLGAGRVEAFRLLDAADRILLEIHYSSRREGRCGVPAAIDISGSKVRGSVECTFERVFPADSLAAGTFALTVPEGFSMEKVR